MRAGPATEGLHGVVMLRRDARTSSDHTVTMFVLTSMLPCTAFEYGQS